MAPSQNLSVQLDAPDDNNPFNEYTVYPKSPEKIADISRKIEAIVKTGFWELIKSPSRPEWHGVLFWSLTTEDDEARRLKAALGSDVGLFPEQRYSPRLADVSTRPILFMSEYQ